jgi:protein-tyrosine-phosphatase
VSSILFVCTGNICRSPTAEGFARAMVVEGGGGIEVSSAGIVGWEGSPAARESVQAAAECGIDISRHVARRLEERHVRDADVIVCMSEEHCDAVVRLVPDAAGKTFTLKELVRLVEARPATDGSTFHERVAAAHELRTSGFLGEPDDEDVADPLGATMDSFRAVAWELEEWTRRLSPGLIPETSRQEVS